MSGNSEFEAILIDAWIFYNGLSGFNIAKSIVRQIEIYEEQMTDECQYYSLWSFIMATTEPETIGYFAPCLN